ncbi:MAG TPA: hypothetical protein VLT57_02575, partial [Bryobacteraceae bacterium]|nr:hypothetical protein [Bryobacteraceae bacterium]
MMSVVEPQPIARAAEPGKTGMAAGYTAAEEPSTAGEASLCSRYVPLCVWLIAFAALVCIPLKIASYGYLPADDALRHAAKAVTQRPWSEILVLRSDFTMDHNPGWHWVLGQVHRATGVGTDGLVVSSLVGLFLLAMAAPMVVLRRPEAWMGALLASTLMFPPVLFRVLLARPFVVSMTATLMVLLLWRRDDRQRPSAWILGATALLLGVSAWVHGSWYLFALVVAAFALAGQWRSACWLAGCWLAGSFAGALLTGHPVGFLVNAIRIGLNCFSGDTLQRMLAFEFWPSDGNVLAVVAVSALLLWRYVIGAWDWKCINNPIFVLSILGWILGLRVSRFYYDWGAPALLLWVALELSEHCGRLLRPNAPQRLAVTAAISLALFFGITSDLNGRWTNTLFTEFLSESDPEMQPWLPESGGILYSSDMTVFYQTFFKN